MLLKEAQPTIHKLRRREAAGPEHDPASLGAALRELAVRAHRLVRTMDKARLHPAPRPDAGTLFNLERELVELRAEIVQLQRNLRAQDLGNLDTYVSALLQRVEEYLA
jgi:hypothetical protein